MDIQREEVRRERGGRDDSHSIDFWARRHGALRALQDEDVRALRAVAGLHIYAKSRTIGEPRYGEGGFFAVASGAVILLRRVSEHRCVPVCHRRRKGDIFALGFPGDPRARGSAAKAARSDTAVYSVPWLDVLELCSSHPAIARAVALVEREMEMEEQEFVVELASCDAIARLMYSLYLLAQDYEDHLVRETREEIAREAVISRQEVTRALPLLEKQQLIGVERYQRSILVPRPSSLLAAYQRRREM